jgi:hypothetical protein
MDIYDYQYLFYSMRSMNTRFGFRKARLLEQGSRLLYICRTKASDRIHGIGVLKLMMVSEFGRLNVFIKELRICHKELFASEDEFVLDTPEQGLFASAHVCNIG